MTLIEAAKLESVPPLNPAHGRRGLSKILLWITAAVASFHLAYVSASLAWFSILYLFALIQLGRAETWRKAFYGGLGVGLLIAVGRLDFFWGIFGMGSLALWLVYAFWIALFPLAVRLCWTRLPPTLALCAIPVTWGGLEYFRSELYYLRFSWLTPGYAFGLDPYRVPLSWLGIYGVGIVLAAFACAAAALAQRKRAVPALLVVGAGMAGLYICGTRLQLPKLRAHAELPIAGIQMEFPAPLETLAALDELHRRCPEARLLVLSEYTFDGPLPEKVRSWCRRNRQYLIAGAKYPASGNQFYNTAVVVSPDGEIVFSQVKAVPIQFFKDGMPAAEQRVWSSPWGKLGICICYDLSYARVTDELIRLGAEAIIVPTMDVADWGLRQHQLHARIGPVRAAEYRVPVFRLASSGISQAIDAQGKVLASAPFPGNGAVLNASLTLAGPGRRPLDRWFGPGAAALTALGAAVLIIETIASKLRKRRLE